MASLEQMSREEHYRAIDDALERAQKAQTMNPGKSAVAAAEAQVHASVLVEKALRDRA